MSHPVWVRGLKLVLTLNILGFFRSHPVWVRGLKLRSWRIFTLHFRSHPVWVRGLKLLMNGKIITLV